MQNAEVVIQTKQYDFLRENDHLGENIILLSFSGSYAHGIAEEYADVNLLGCAVNKPSDILGLSVFDHYTDKETNTTVQSFFKTAMLLKAGDIITSEMLGCDRSQYAIVSPLGKQLLANKSLFFSQKTASAYYGYIKALEEFLCDAGSRLKLGRQCLEKSILSACEKPMQKFNKVFSGNGEGDSYAKLFIAPPEKDRYEPEVFMDAEIHNCPIRNFTDLLTSLQNITEVQQRGAAVRKLLDKHWLGKKMCTAVRLLLTCCELLESGQVHTNREKDADLLIPIRDGKYILPNCNIDDAFFDILNPLLQRVEYARENTVLPPEPDNDLVNEFVMEISRKVIRRKKAAAEMPAPV